MTPIAGTRLIKHTMLLCVLMASTVLAPILLLTRHRLGSGSIFVAIGLMAMGTSTLIGAVLCRALDRSACHWLQWRMIIAAPWILNPVVILAYCMYSGNEELGWWNAMPLAGVLCFLSGKLRLSEGDPDWYQEDCITSFARGMHWLFSRIIFIAMPLAFTSLQVDLYLPKTSMFPPGTTIVFFICGGCILISGKFCIMCACLAHQKFAQAFVLALLLAADWLCSLHMMTLINDDSKVTVLLYILLISGLVQTRNAQVRMQLIPRWKRACAQRRARQIGREGQDVELGASMNAEPFQESSDSDNETGPGSLPDGYHETLITLLGVVPASRANARRQFLCGVRRATFRNGGASTPSQATPASTNSPNGLLSIVPEESQQDSDRGSDSGTISPLEISETERVCVVCQDEIQMEDRVRPLPKCSHVFHATCLERWVREKREATVCPTCRRPALGRKESKGAIKLSDLTNEEESTPTSTGRGSTTGGNSRGSRAAVPPSRVRPPTISRAPARPAERAQFAIMLHNSLGVSEAMAKAAVEVALGGRAEIAANLLLEHRGVLDNTYRSGVTAPLVPPELLVVIVQANPNLAGAEDGLRRQLTHLYSCRRLQPNRWSSASLQQDVFKALLEDVSRRLA